MATHCTTCGVPLADKKNLYCGRHAKATLRKLHKSGYLQPLTIRTVDGVQKLSKRRFLELPSPSTPSYESLP